MTNIINVCIAFKFICIILFFKKMQGKINILLVPLNFLAAISEPIIELRICMYFISPLMLIELKCLPM